MGEGTDSKAPFVRKERKIYILHVSRYLLRGEMRR